MQIRRRSRKTRHCEKNRKHIAAFLKKHYNRTNDYPYLPISEGLQEEPMKGNKFIALLLSGVLAASVLTGCGGMNKEETVATMDGEPVTLGVANFAVRLQQAGYDDFYVAYFGADVWSSDLYGNGTTMETQTKNTVMDSIRDMYTLQKHMGEYDISLSEEENTAITQAASAFISSNKADAIEALGATQEIVEEYLTLATIQSKMREAIIADADTVVSDEEANTSAYSYVKISKETYQDADGNSVEYTEEELAALKETAEAFAAEVKDRELEDAAEAEGYSVSTGTFTAEDETLNEAILSALKGLKEGEVSGLIDTESDYYVVRLDAITDAEATEATRKSIITSRQDSLYDEVLNGWKETSEWVLNEKVWAAVTFDNLFTSVVESTQTELPESTEP